MKGVEGVNHRLVPLFKKMKGKRLGIVMFDFFEQPADLLPLFLSLLPPVEAQEDAKT
jgi:1-phosphatidylinositol phosphodiesterase